MRDAVAELLNDAERCVITIRQAEFNRDKGSQQPRELVLFENDQLDLTTQLDPRLRRARRVQIFLVDKSRAAALIRFPQRSWEVVAEGSDLRKKLTSFSDNLTAGARSRIFTPTAAIWLIVFPVLVGGAPIAVYSAIQGYRHPNKPAQTIHNPHWMDTFFAAWIYTWPAFIAAALALVIVNGIGGALGVWPKTLTRGSISEAMYKIQAIIFTPTNIASIITGVVIAVVAALITLWVSH